MKQIKKKSSEKEYERPYQRIEPESLQNVILSYAR